MLRMDLYNHSPNTCRLLSGRKWSTMINRWSFRMPSHNMMVASRMHVRKLSCLLSKKIIATCTSSVLIPSPMLSVFLIDRPLHAKCHDFETASRVRTKTAISTLASPHLHTIPKGNQARIMLAKSGRCEKQASMCGNQAQTEMNSKSLHSCLSVSNNN